MKFSRRTLLEMGTGAAGATALYTFLPQLANVVLSQAPPHDPARPLEHPRIKARTDTPPPQVANPNLMRGLWMSYQLGARPKRVKLEPDAIVMYPFDVVGAPGKPIDAHYCNLYDEKDSGKYGPYLQKTETGKQYDESRPDPAHAGFMRNITDQLDKVAQFKVVEWDNIDAYRDADVIRAYDETLKRGIHVFCKNPIDTPIRSSLMNHAAVIGIIQEVDLDNDFSPVQYVDKTIAHRPHGMPVHFVVNNNRRAADAIVSRIVVQEAGLMSVSLGPADEYATSKKMLGFL